SFLTAGGVVNPPSPGSYFATTDSRITTVDTSGGQDVMHTTPTGDLPGPRWFPSGVLLPTGEVLAFNGSDRDEVAGPGVEIYSPPYLYWGPRPQIEDTSIGGNQLGYGRTFTITTDVPASRIASAVLVSNPSVTHLVDPNQRNLQLRVLSRSGNTLTVAGPPN